MLRTACPPQGAWKCWLPMAPWLLVGHGVATLCNKSMGCVLLLSYNPSMHQTRIAHWLGSHRSGQPHGCPRGDSADEPLTLDPGAQAVSGLRYKAYGVSRCREDRDSASQAPHGGSLMAPRGVVGLKMVRKPPPTLVNHPQSLTHCRSNLYGP